MPDRVFARGVFAGPSMVIDEAGHVHVAVTLERGIAYVTNASGAWTRETLSTPTGPDETDGDASIAIDTDGMLAVAFARRTCREMWCSLSRIYLARNTGRGWSEPVQVGLGIQPSLQLRDGHVHLTYVALRYFSDMACDEPAPVMYLTDSTGEWVEEPVARNGERPALGIASNGVVHIVFGDFGCEFLGQAGIYDARLARQGTFVLEPVPGTTSENSRLVSMVLDARDALHLLFLDVSAETRGLYAVRRAVGWSEPEFVLEGGAVAMAVDANGWVHVLALGDNGVWYATNASGEFVSSPIAGDPTWSGFGGSVAIDGDGRPHFLYVTGQPEHPSTGLWYAVGP